jgi:DNA-binding transcriptional regulator YiaG
MDERSVMTGTQLKTFRYGLGLSSRGFAKALGLPGWDGAQVRGWETGKREVPWAVQTLIEMVEACPQAREWLEQRAGQKAKYLPPLTKLPELRDAIV